MGGFGKVFQGQLYLTGKLMQQIFCPTISSSQKAEAESSSHPKPEPKNAGGHVQLFEYDRHRHVYSNGLQICKKKIHCSAFVPRIYLVCLEEGTLCML